MKNFIKISVAVAIGCSITACDRTTVQDDRIYTLYRNTPSTEEARIHVATFDSLAYSSGDVLDELMNKRNCELVATMFQERPMWGESLFWCEKGKYRK